jgi:tRNA-2-methylthio-N6-dimethylallyladenosine synthase
MIVGFPTETDEDFDLTKTLVRRLRFKNHFIFKYSPRPGTVAIDRFQDDVPDAVKKRRINELLATQAEISAMVHAEQVGRIVEVMVEGLSRQEARAAANVEIRWEAPRGGMQLIGRTSGDLIVSFASPRQACADELMGSIQRVEITGSGGLILFGQLCEAAATARA